MRDKVVIVHFLPLEYYPPVMNLLRYIQRRKLLRGVVCTSALGEGRLKRFSLEGSDLDIRRWGKLRKATASVFRYMHYLWFNLASLFTLVLVRPRKVLYVESISSFPVFLYKRFIARRAEVMIHYHEYTSPAEYEGGMSLVKYFHRKELDLYEDAIWISHTNEDRLQLFIKDVGLKNSNAARIMPNYPPRSWIAAGSKVRSAEKLRVVYAGSLSLETMFVKEFAAWVVSQEGRVTWDIYAYNVAGHTANYLDGLKTDCIRLLDGVDYDSLPSLFGQYDVGIVLYRGHIPNYVYNAPNKLFEYLACGLDVWFPTVMKGMLPYVRTNALPKILPLDFDRMGNFDLAAALDRTGMLFDSSPYFCEAEYERIHDVLTK